MKHASPHMTAAFIERAISYDGSDCLLWPFAKDRGYGRTGAGYVHREVCAAVYGPQPPDHEVAHSCGVRACINPAHLRWDTVKGNQADQFVHYGRHSNARLTVEQVKAIRASSRTDRELAAEYQVVKATISHIRTKRNWNWL